MTTLTETSLHQEIIDTFAPRVLDLLEDFDAPTNLEWGVELCATMRVSIMLGQQLDLAHAGQYLNCYDLTLQYPEPINVHTLERICIALDRLCYLDGAAADGVIGDYVYRIGDGDDSGAVRFAGGKFRIWVRTWFERG